jgi:hypothetical protein
LAGFRGAGDAARGSQHGRIVPEKIRAGPFH